MLAVFILLGSLAVATDAINRPFLNLGVWHTLILICVAAAAGAAHMLIDLNDPFFELDIAITGDDRTTTALRFTLGDSYNPMPVAQAFARRHNKSDRWIDGVASIMASLDPTRGVRARRRGPTRLVFVHSTGRCGTEYLAHLLSVSDDVVSFHEAGPPMRGPKHVVCDRSFPSSLLRSLTVTHLSSLQICGQRLAPRMGSDVRRARVQGRPPPRGPRGLLSRPRRPAPAPAAVRRHLAPVRKDVRRRGARSPRRVRRLARHHDRRAAPVFARGAGELPAHRVARLARASVLELLRGGGQLQPHEAAAGRAAVAQRARFAIDRSHLNCCFVAGR